MLDRERIADLADRAFERALSPETGSSPGFPAGPPLSAVGFPREDPRSSVRGRILHPGFLHQKLSGKAAVMGHSMGGGASFLAAEANPTIDGLAVLAPAETNPSAISAAAGITAPTLVFSGTKDCVASASQHQMPMYNASASTCKTYVSIAGGSHCQFAINNTLCSLGEIFCGGAGISRSTQHAIVSSLLLPWLDGVLRSDWQRWQSFEVTLAAGSGFTAQQSCPVSPAPVPACTNGVDDDGDGAIDFPADTLCQGAWDPDEAANPASCGLLGPVLLLVLAALRLRSRARP